MYSGLIFNPRKRAASTFGVATRRDDKMLSFKKDRFAVEGQVVVIFDWAELERKGFMINDKTIPYILIGFLSLTTCHQTDDEQRHGIYSAYQPFHLATCFQPGLSAAKEGYGPLLYDTAAEILNKPVMPSPDVSPHARMFWRRQNNRIDPLPDGEFKNRYGQWIEDLLQRGEDMPDEMYDVADRFAGRIVNAVGEPEDYRQLCFRTGADLAKLGWPG